MQVSTLSRKYSSSRSPYARRWMTRILLLIFGNHPINSTRVPSRRRRAYDDRESDIHELFLYRTGSRTNFLIRTVVDRLAGDGDHTVADEMDDARVKGLHRIEVRDKNDASPEVGLTTRAMISTMMVRRMRLRISTIGVRIDHLVNARPANQRCFSFGLDRPTAKSPHILFWADCMTFISVLHDGQYFCAFQPRIDLLERPGGTLRPSSRQAGESISSLGHRMSNSFSRLKIPRNTLLDLGNSDRTR
jgi:hypothetical protein